MDEKKKKTKKTITDEILEDNFFKPPIEDIIDEEIEEKTKVNETEQEPVEQSENLLFDEFLKSPDEAAHDVISDQASAATGARQESPAKAEPVVVPGKPLLVARTAEPTGSKLKVIVASLGGAVVILAIGVVLLYFHHHPNGIEHNNVIPGAQTVIVKRPKKSPVPAVKSVTVNKVPVKTVHKIPAVKPKPSRPAQIKVAKIAPPVVKHKPVRKVNLRFEVLLRKIGSDSALNNVKRIAAKTDRSLNFNVKKNKITHVGFHLFINKIYPSEGEAIAGSLKLIVVNISNSSVIKADGGYRILVGKYTSKAGAMAIVKSIHSAGMKELIKKVSKVTYTYNLKVYPFKSDREAKTYMAKVKKYAAKATFAKIK